MTVVVKTSRPNAISVDQGSKATGSIVVKRGDALTVQSLSNVDTTTLQDGYTLIYDSDTNTWISQPLSAGAISSVDGGTY